MAPNRFPHAPAWGTRNRAEPKDRRKMRRMVVIDSYLEMLEIREKKRREDQGSKGC
jgi:hypothetical protein